jgi:hypothetical protein
MGREFQMSSNKLALRKPEDMAVFSEALGLTKDEAILLMLSIIQGFAFQVMSHDRLSLSVGLGKRLAVKNGIDPEKAKVAVDNLMVSLDEVRRKNIISGMF